MLKAVRLRRARRPGGRRGVCRQLRSFSDLISGLVCSGHQLYLHVASAVSASVPDRLCAARSRHRRDRGDRHPSGLDLHRLGAGPGDGVPVCAAQPSTALCGRCRMGTTLRAARVTTRLTAAPVHPAPAPARPGGRWLSAQLYSLGRVTWWDCHGNAYRRTCFQGAALPRPRLSPSAPTGSLWDDRADNSPLQPAVVNLVSVDLTAVAAWAAGLATDWQRHRRHVRVRAFFPIPGAPERFFIKVTNLLVALDRGHPHLVCHGTARRCPESRAVASGAAVSRLDGRDLDPCERRPGCAPRRVQGARMAFKRQGDQVQARYARPASWPRGRVRSHSGALPSAPSLGTRRTVTAVWRAHNT